MISLGRGLCSFLISAYIPLFWASVHADPVMAEVSQPELSESSATRAVAVSGNMAPLLFVPPTIVADEGTTLSIEVHGTDTDPADVLLLTQVSPLALNLTLNASVAPRLIISKLNGSLGYNDAGTYNIQWYLTDGVNPPVTATSTLTVRDAAPPPGAPPISVFPQDVLQGVRTAISIKGVNFGTATWVELRGSKGTVRADTVAILTATSLMASLMVPPLMAGQYEVVVTGPGGDQKLPSGVIVSTYRIEALDPETGQPLPRLGQHGPPLAPALSAAFPCEGINFCSTQRAVGVSPPQRCVNAGVSPFVSVTSLIYRTTFGGFDRRCWTKLKVRHQQEIGSPVQTGGHCHSDENRPLGAPTDTAGFTSDGTTPDFVVPHRWPEASGQIEGVLWSTDPNCPGLADSLNGDFIYCLFASSRFSVLLGLRTAGPGDSLIGTFPQHPTNWGMIPGMAAALDSVSIKWAAKYPSGPKLQFNDASLPWGGLFDAVNFNWTPDHCGHRVGAEMDIRSWALSSRQKRWANTFFRSHNFIVHPEKKPPHWHLYYVGPDTFRGPGSPIDWAEQRYGQ